MDSLAWIVVRNFLVSISLQKGLPPLNAPSATVSLSNHLIWGAVTAVVIVRLLPFREESTAIVTETCSVRKISFVPVPARKQEQKERKVRFVKPKKL